MYRLSLKVMRLEYDFKYDAFNNEMIPMELNYLFKKGYVRDNRVERNKVRLIIFFI